MGCFNSTGNGDEDGEVRVSGNGDDDDVLLDGMAATPKRKKSVSKDGLLKARKSRDYPELTRLAGVVDQLNSLDTVCLEFVGLMLCAST